MRKAECMSQVLHSDRGKHIGSSASVTMEVNLPSRPHSPMRDIVAALMFAAVFALGKGTTPVSFTGSSTKWQVTARNASILMDVHISAVRLAASTLTMVALALVLSSSYLLSIMLLRARLDGRTPSRLPQTAWIQPQRQQWAQVGILSQANQKNMFWD